MFNSYILITAHATCLSRTLREMFLVHYQDRDLKNSLKFDDYPVKKQKGPNLTTIAGSFWYTATRQRPMMIGISNFVNIEEDIQGGHKRHYLVEWSSGRLNFIISPGFTGLTSQLQSTTRDISDSSLTHCSPSTTYLPKRRLLHGSVYFGAKENTIRFQLTASTPQVLSAFDDFIPPSVCPSL